MNFCFNFRSKCPIFDHMPKGLTSSLMVLLSRYYEFEMLIILPDRVNDDEFVVCINIRNFIFEFVIASLLFI